ncbi:DUF3231 family protein [Priestia megaterium]
MLTYINHMAKAGMLAYSGFVSMSAREDIRTYFTAGLQEVSALFNQSSIVALLKEYSFDLLYSLSNNN